MKSILLLGIIVAMALRLGITEVNAAAIHTAASWGDWAKVEELLDGGTDVNTVCDPFRNC